MALLAAVLAGALLYVLVFPWASPGVYTSTKGVFAVMGGEAAAAQNDSWSADFLAALHYKIDRNSRLAREFAMSDLGETMTLEDIYAYKLLVPTAVSLVSGVYAWQGDTFLTLVMLLSSALYFAIDALVSVSADAARRRVQQAVPAFLQALAVMMEAGLNLVPAITEYTRRVKDPLAVQLAQAVEESRLGMPVPQALMRCADRCEVPDLHLAVSALVQGLERGAAGLSTVVREQAREAWEKRRDAAREMGQKASVKLFLPLLVLVFPVFLLFLMGPALVSFFNNF